MGVPRIGIIFLGSTWGPPKSANLHVLNTGTTENRAKLGASPASITANGTEAPHATVGSRKLEYGPGTIKAVFLLLQPQGLGDSHVPTF